MDNPTNAHEKSKVSWGAWTADECSMMEHGIVNLAADHPYAVAAASATVAAALLLMSRGRISVSEKILPEASALLDGFLVDGSGPEAKSLAGNALNAEREVVDIGKIPPVFSESGQNFEIKNGEKIRVILGDLIDNIEEDHMDPLWEHEADLPSSEVFRHVAKSPDLNRVPLLDEYDDVPLIVSPSAKLDTGALKSNRFNIEGINKSRRSAARRQGLTELPPSAER